MDSAFKNNEIRKLNLKIGQPNEILRENECETIFEYLYQINSKLAKMELTNVENKLDSINGKLSASGGHVYENYSIADMMSIMCNILSLVHNVIGDTDCIKTYNSQNGW